MCEKRNNNNTGWLIIGLGGHLHVLGCGGSDATPSRDMDPKPQHTKVTLSLGGVTHTIYLQSAVKRHGTDPTNTSRRRGFHQNK